MFEPNPVAAARARENVTINQLPFEFHEFAVYGVQGTVDFEDAGSASTCNRMAVGFETNVPTRTVRRVTIDEFFGDRKAY